LPIWAPMCFQSAPSQQGQTIQSRFSMPIASLALQWPGLLHAPVEATPLILAGAVARDPPLVTTQVSAPAPRPHVRQGFVPLNGPPPAPPTARQAHTNHPQPPNSASPTSLAPTPAPAQRSPVPKGPTPADQGRQHALAVLLVPTQPPLGGCLLPRAPSALRAHTPRRPKDLPPALPAVQEPTTPQLAPPPAPPAPLESLPVGWALVQTALSVAVGPSPTPLGKASACCAPLGGTIQLAAASLYAPYVLRGSFPAL
jgi:hypothetical protein